MGAKFCGCDDDSKQGTQDVDSDVNILFNK